MADVEDRSVRGAPDDDVEAHDRLSSPALGLGQLIGPGGGPRRPAEPPPPAQGPPVGVTLSGGGFRATLAALGVLRMLADARLLANLRYSSSVSGGSIANGVLATRWPGLRAGATPAPRSTSCSSTPSSPPSAGPR